MPVRKQGAFSAWNIFKLILAIGLVVFLFSRTDIASIVSAVKGASIFWLGITFALFILMTLLKTLQYYVLLRNEMTFWQTLNVIVWQNTVTNFLLAGAGIAAYITISRAEHKVRVSQSVVTFLLVKIGDLTGIWLALLLSGWLVWSQIGVLQTPTLILLIGIGAVLLVFFLTILFRDGFVSLLDKILERFGLSKISLVERGMSYLQGLANIKHEELQTPLLLLFLTSFIYLVVTLIWNYASLAIFHLQMDAMPLVFVSSLMQLVSYFPIYVFGGIGITETSSLYFWSFFQIPQDALAPALIGIRAVFYLSNLIPLIYLPLYAATHKPKERTAI